MGAASTPRAAREEAGLRRMVRHSFEFMCPIVWPPDFGVGDTAFSALGRSVGAGALSAGVCALKIRKARVGWRACGHGRTHAHAGLPSLAAKVIRGGCT